MTDAWRLPDGRIVDDDGLYDYLTEAVDDDYAVRHLDDAYPEIDVCGHTYPAGGVARSVWDAVMWTALKDDIIDGIYVDRDYGSLEEFGIEPVDDGSRDCAGNAVTEGGQA